MSERHRLWKSLLGDPVSRPKRIQGIKNPDLRVQRLTDLETEPQKKKTHVSQRRNSAILPFLCLFVMFSTQMASCYPSKLRMDFEPTLKFLYNQLMVTPRNILFHALKLIVKSMHTAPILPWAELEEDTPCMLCGSIKKRETPGESPNDSGHQAELC